MKRCGVLVSAIFLLFLTTVSFAAPVFAAPAEGINLVTSPLPINLETKPGTTVTADLRIKNGGNTPQKLKVSLMKFSAYGDEGKPFLSDRQAGDDYFDWVSFSPSTFDAQPNEWKTVKMTVKVPKSAAFGYYYAPVFSKASVEKPTDGRTNALVGSTAVLVLLDAQVPGAKREVQLTGFTADRSFYEFLPPNFTIKVHNNGNIHTAPGGDIFIFQGKKHIATLPVNGARGNVLPGTNRLFTTMWTDGFPVFEKDAKGKDHLKWNFDSPLSKLRIGRYTAKLTLVYDNGGHDVPLEGELTFWVIPWRLFGLLLIVLIPAVFWFIRYRRIKRELKQYRQKKTA